MRILSLTHVVKATLALSRADRIYIFGSASLLASFPELGEEPSVLENTYDADVLLEPISKEIAAILGEAIGVRSLFRQNNGYHADILHPSITDPFPPGWKDRLVPLEGFSNVWALDPHDLAMVKICVGRDKDLELVRALLSLKKLECSRLRELFSLLPLGEKELFRAGRNLGAVCPAC